MDDKTQIPYIVYEAEMTRSERNFKRLWVVVIILISLLVATNLCWLAYESQFETVEQATEAAQENSGGYNNYVGTDKAYMNLRQGFGSAFYFCKRI